MPKIKVQSRKVRYKDKIYEQYWVGLPKALCEALQIKAGNGLDVFIERGDLVLRPAP